MAAYLKSETQKPCNIYIHKQITLIKETYSNVSNVPSSIVYSANGAESLRIARASNNPESFSTAIKPLIARMSRLGVSIVKINSSIVKIFNITHILIMFVEVRKNC